MDRRLAAILYADVAGYSRLTGVDEEGTHQQLNAGLDRLTSAIDEAGGRVVHEAGDAILAEFNSTISALQCAADFQRAMADQKPAEQDGERLAFRVGINLGEVIDDRDDIYGDGVNVAARLEGLAETGGICISRAVYDQAQGKIDLGYEYLGEQSVKNIAKPVRAYKVLLDPADAGKLLKADHTSAAKAWWRVCGRPSSCAGYWRWRVFMAEQPARFYPRQYGSDGAGAARQAVHCRAAVHQYVR
jgi:adenylate cyclase